MSRSQFILLLGIFAIYCGLTVFVPPFDDEFYYWCWSEELQLSYYDHPPMSAYMIRAATTVFGDTLFAIRLPACISTIFALGVILTLTKPKTVGWWLLATPLFSFGAVIVTPDTPLVMFWAAYVYWLVKVHERLTPSEGDQGIPFHYWLIGGILLGCGVLGKYTMGLAVPAGFLTFVLAGRWSKWFLGYALHGVVSFLVASPILIHNIRQDFAPLMYQWKHSMGTIQPSFAKFSEFVGIQMLLFGTMPLVLLPWVLLNAKRFVGDPRLRVCLCLYGFPFAFFLYKATRGPLEGNWALVSYIAFWPLAAVWYERVRHSPFWKIGMPASFIPPMLAIVFAVTHLIRPLPFIPAASDRILRQKEKYELAQRIKVQIDQLPEKLPVYTDTYQWVALLRFCGVDAHQIEGVTRPSHFTQKPEYMTDVPRAYLFWDGLPKKETTTGFGPPQPELFFPLKIRGELVAAFAIWKYEKPR